MKRMAPHSRNTAAARAFTLLELLVASAIFAIVMASLYVVFHGALRLRETTFREVESALPVSAIETIVKRDLNCAVAPTGLFCGAFTGTTEEKTKERSDTLAFYAASGIIEEQKPWGDVQAIEYYLADAENPDQAAGRDLVRALTRNLLPTVAEDPQEQRLLHGVKSLLFQYYDGTQWLDYWDSTTMENEIPTAVRLRIEFAETDTAEADKNEKPARVIETVCELVVRAPSTDTASQSSGAQNSGGGSAGI